MPERYCWRLLAGFVGDNDPEQRRVANLLLQAREVLAQALPGMGHYQRSLDWDFRGMLTAVAIETTKVQL